MTYFKPYVDSTGLHIPTYNDILEDMIAAMKQIYGDDIYLDNSSPDYQLLSIFALKQSDTLQAMAYATTHALLRLLSARHSTAW